MTEQPDRVVIRDKRRIDPVTGEARHAEADQSVASPSGGTKSAEDSIPKAPELLLEERTRDLQRLQAEYANYRKRVDRDRVSVGELAAGRVLAALLPILDDIDRAREHGDLTGAFKAVADQLDTVLAKNGLVAFGEPGDRFDPAIHEAVLHTESPDVDRPTATTVMRRGYRHGERLLRPAMVGVTDPAAPSAESSEPTADSTPAAADSGDQQRETAAGAAE
jgi:molecular chaperone GrpE